MSEDNNKYYILGGLILLAGLTWFFWDDITPILTNSINKLQSFRRRPDNNSTTSSDVLPIHIEENSWSVNRFRSSWEWIKSKFTRSNNDTIRDEVKKSLLDKGKGRAIDSIIEDIILEDKTAGPSNIRNISPSYDELFKSSAEEADHWSEGTLSPKNIIGASDLPKSLYSQVTCLSSEDTIKPINPVVEKLKNMHSDITRENVSKTGLLEQLTGARVLKPVKTVVKDRSLSGNVIPEEMVSSNILGKMKLENIITKGIFLSPKVYMLKTETGVQISKIKGLSHDVELTIQDFKNLLYRDAFLKQNSN